MQGEIIAAIILGFWMGAPVGWFVKSALTWRRDARRLASAEPKPIPPPASSIAVDSRLETLVERVSQRLETLEDRLEFTERLLETRTQSALADPRARRSPATPQEPGPQSGPSR